MRSNEMDGGLARQVGRREFTLESALALLAGVAITISACEPDNMGTGPDETPTPAPNPEPTPMATPTAEPTPMATPTPEPTPVATPTPQPTPYANVSGTISGNHGHVATITGAQLSAGGALMLDIRGSSSHPHSVTLSMSDVQQIAAGMRVSRESTSNSGHSHTVTFN